MVGLIGGTKLAGHRIREHEARNRECGMSKLSGGVKRDRYVGRTAGTTSFASTERGLQARPGDREDTTVRRIMDARMMAD